MTQETKTTGSWFTGALLLLFIACKLTGFINWSWWWVLSPLWILPAILIAGLAVWIIYLVLTDKIKDSRKEPASRELSSWQQRIKEMKEKQNS